MTFNAASRLRSLEDRSAALGSSRCELPGMHSAPKSAVLPYASGVGGLSRRLLNTPYLGTLDLCRKCCPQPSKACCKLQDFSRIKTRAITTTECVGKLLVLRKGASAFSAMSCQPVGVLIDANVGRDHVEGS